MKAGRTEAGALARTAAPHTGKPTGADDAVAAAAVSTRSERRPPGPPLSPSTRDASPARPPELPREGVAQPATAGAAVPVLRITRDIRAAAAHSVPEAYQTRS
ncbi:hypothetical protein Shyhy01_43480 [Streptomyces hygroscopicus subsp. hygroscopicus]|nr:hypothetical protein Shyhy01_43480 [Streptomyces hygroscopicus subsp. hygroscopicus]